MRDFNSTSTVEPSSPVGRSQHLEAEGFSLQERLYTPQQVADRLGVSERWVRDHATRRNPRIRAIKLGPLLRFRWSDVQAFVAELATQKPFKYR